MIPFQIDPSWYERYWWHDSAPRKPGIFAFFHRILSQQRLTWRQGVRADHQIPHSLRAVRIRLVRSVYLLSGAVRNSWQRSIVPMDVLRYCVTLRTFRPGHGAKD